MKRILILVATLALAACASPRTATIEDGKVTNITSAEAVTLVKQDVRRQKVADVQANAKPIFELKTQPGQTIQISGVESITVNVPQDLRELLAEQPDAVSENVQMLREVRGIARETAVPLGLGGMALADRNSARKSATEQAEIAAGASVELETMRSAERQSMTSKAIEAAEKPPLVLHVPLGTTAPSE
jgi:hypothetical protein